MGETTIGRQSDRNISLSSDNTASRQHARVANEGGQFVLYDMGSANGTHVNNSRIDRHVLTPGDLVQIGNTKFRYEV
jgi:pSer/pThr/pTyr-binding forkhead associated (FHA) protein